ncbi:hypothetical protein [Allocoleopsis sp.]|uniref:hypothetical protein n=1 Tax=Allocoleopsis sp. TaxID=3088169 RepID=UPI002FCECB94
MRHAIRAAIEIVLWVAAMSVVTSLTGCNSHAAQQAAQQESGADQQCVLTSNGQDCRSPDGISQQ